LRHWILCTGCTVCRGRRDAQERPLARLAAPVPKSCVNLTRFHGVFAPNSKHRALVTPDKRGKGNKARVPDEPPTPAKCRAVDGKLLLDRGKKAVYSSIPYA